MADPEHLEILKQGVRAWNQWRSENPLVMPLLDRTTLPRSDLDGINFRNADLMQTDLSGARLVRANLYQAEFYGADLRGAVLRMADLRGAKLHAADLSGADLRGADLYRADFISTKLGGAMFNEAVCANTAFSFLDLTGVIGLDEVFHEGPSSIDTHTLLQLRDSKFVAFLRGAGVVDELITYLSSPDLQPAQFQSCFISYSSKDQGFSERLHADLQSKGVRCWFAPEDLKIGDPFRDRIDEYIRIYDKLLLILSGNSVLSQWVGNEVEAALERERKENRTVLFPIRIDDAVMDSDKAWATTIRRTRHVGDFTRWKDHDSYQRAFERLLRDLKAGV